MLFRSGPDSPSVFASPWTPLVRRAPSAAREPSNPTAHEQPSELEDAQAQADMDTLFRLRSRVHALLESGRRDGVVKSSLAADVAIGVSSASTSEIIDLLGREGARRSTIHFARCPDLAHFQSTC